MRYIDKLFLLGAIDVAVTANGSLDIAMGGIKGKWRNGIINYAKEHKEDIIYDYSDPAIVVSPSQFELKSLFEDHSMKCSECPYWQRIGLCSGFCRVTGYDTSNVARCIYVDYGDIFKIKGCCVDWIA